ncbi:hypothetical protein BS78_08G165300 [Paspalum vaginatum]|nr:hypothetical protein BS78_08G165300 [Paspalum vaginatum]
MDSVDDWVVLGSCASSSDDDRVIALSSSGCTTPGASSASDSDSDSDSTTANKLLLATDDADGLYALSDAEEDYAYPPPSPPLPKPLSGLFHHTRSSPAAVAYAAFDPSPSARGHRAFKRLVPDPTFSAFFSEPVRALASTSGLVCLRGSRSGAYYVANPATFARAELPRPHRDHAKFGDPAVVIAFDDGGLGDSSSSSLLLLAHSASADHPRPFYRHYRVVVAFPVGYGAYAFEAFSSRTWGWAVGEAVAAAETVVPASGVGALGCAFWRTTMGLLLCYEPASGCADLVHAPAEVVHWPRWELGEMEGALCAVCMDDRAGAGLADVLVVRIDFATRDHSGGVGWTIAGHFEGGCLRGRTSVELLRAQGKAEVVMWDPVAEVVVAMDLEGRTTRTINFVPGSGYHDDFIPYVCSLAGISGSGNGPPADGWIAATNGAHAEYRAMALGAETY